MTKHISAKAGKNEEGERVGQTDEGSKDKET